jgi:hypothetical protein
MRPVQRRENKDPGLPLWFKILEIIQKNIHFSIGIFKIGASNPMKLRNASE